MDRVNAIGTDTLAFVTYKVWEITPECQYVEGWITTIDHQELISDVRWLESAPKPSIPPAR